MNVVALLSPKNGNFAPSRILRQEMLNANPDFVSCNELSTEAILLHSTTTTAATINLIEERIQKFNMSANRMFHALVHLKVRDKELIQWIITKRFKKMTAIQKLILLVMTEDLDMVCSYMNLVQSGHIKSFLPVIDLTSHVDETFLIQVACYMESEKACVCAVNDVLCHFASTRFCLTAYKICEEAQEKTAEIIMSSLQRKHAAGERDAMIQMWRMMFRLNMWHTIFAVMTNHSEFVNYIGVYPPIDVGDRFPNKEQLLRQLCPRELRQIVLILKHSPCSLYHLQNASPHVLFSMAMMKEGEDGASVASLARAVICSMERRFNATCLDALNVAIALADFELIEMIVKSYRDFDHFAHWKYVIERFLDYHPCDPTTFPLHVFRKIVRCYNRDSDDEDYAFSITHTRHKAPDTNCLKMFFSGRLDLRPMTTRGLLDIVEQSLALGGPFSIPLLSHVLNTYPKVQFDVTTVRQHDTVHWMFANIPAARIIESVTTGGVKSYMFYDRDLQCLSYWTCIAVNGINPTFYTLTPLSSMHDCPIARATFGVLTSSMQQRYPNEEYHSVMQQLLQKYLPTCEWLRCTMIDSITHQHLPASGFHTTNCYMFLTNYKYFQTTLLAWTCATTSPKPCRFNVITGLPNNTFMRILPEHVTHLQGILSMFTDDCVTNNNLKLNIFMTACEAGHLPIVRYMFEHVGMLIDVNLFTRYECHVRENVFLYAKEKQCVNVMGKIIITEVGLRKLVRFY